MTWEVTIRKSFIRLDFGFHRNDDLAFPLRPSRPLRFKI